MQLAKQFLAYVFLIGLTVTVRGTHVLQKALFDGTDPSGRVYDLGLSHAGVEMERAGASIASEGVIGNVYSPTSGKSAHVSPLYPLFLGGVYWLFGWNPVAERLTEEVVAIIGTTISITLLPTVASAAGLAAVTGWAAAFFLAMSPFNLWIETCGCWEQPYAAVVLVLLVIAFCQLSASRWLNLKHVLFGGVLLGVGALLSPPVFLAGGLMIVSELITQTEVRKQVGRGVVFMVFIACILIGPWVLRNFYAFNAFIPFRSNFGLELQIGNNSEANGKPGGDVHPYSNPKELVHLLQLGEPEYMRRKQEAALSWMRAHPVRALELTAYRFRLFWFPSQDMFGPPSLWRSLQAALFGLIAFAAMLELIRLVAWKHDRSWLLVSAVIGPSLIYLVTHVDMRYRYPVFGVTTILTFNFLLTIIQNVSRKRRSLWPRARPENGRSVDSEPSSQV